MKKIVSVCSARPNFVKVAAVHHALEESADASFTHVIVHTGQHYDPLFSDIFFQELQLPDPAYNLGIKGGDRDQVINDTEAAFAAILPQTCKFWRTNLHHIYSWARCRLFHDLKCCCIERVLGLLVGD